MVVRDIPASILTCYYAGEECGIEEMEEHYVILRMVEIPELISHKLIFSYYDISDGNYKRVEVDDCVVTIQSHTQFYYCLKMTMENEKYKYMLSFVVRQYQRYIRLKYESVDNEFSEELAQYPAHNDEEYDRNGVEWKQKRLEGLESFWAAFADMPAVLGVTLMSPRMYEAFLEGRWKEYVPAAFHKATQFYIGNAYCHLLLPDIPQTLRLCQRIYEKQYQMALVLPVLSEVIYERMDRYLTAVYEWCVKQQVKIEIVVNDFGYFTLLKGKEDRFSFCFGTLLNKRRKDPRYAYKIGFKEQSSRLMENALNDESWTSFLKECGIERFEIETCGYKMALPLEKMSLHFPLYQTNTSQFCTTYALMVHGDRQKQEFVTRCPHFCEKMTILYPSHLSMIGKMNSIFAWDQWLVSHPEVITEYIQQGVDRLVWNMM